MFSGLFRQNRAAIFAPNVGFPPPAARLAETIHQSFRFLEEVLRGSVPPGFEGGAQLHRAETLVRMPLNYAMIAKKPSSR